MSDRPYCPSCGSSTALGEVHCFKCGYINNEYSSTPGYFSVENVNKRNTIVQLRDDIILKPSKFSYAALKWLYDCGVYDDIIVKQGIAYCEQADRVLVPYFCGQELMHYQLRALHGEKDKYKTYGSNKDCPVHYHDHESDFIILVEDHISAIRVRKYYNVIALTGTYLNRETIKLILYLASKVIFWLDPDGPGQLAMYKNINKLKYWADKQAVSSLFTLRTTYNLTINIVDNKLYKKDPKCYLDCEIKDIIERSLQ